MKKSSIICLALAIALSLCAPHFALAGGGKADKEFGITLKNDSARKILIRSGMWQEGYKKGGGKNHRKDLGDLELKPGASYRFVMNIKHDSKLHLAQLFSHLYQAANSIICKIHEAKNVTCTISDNDIRALSSGHVIKDL